MGASAHNMEHFDVILALARIAMDAEGPRATQQIERLRDALAKSDEDQAAKLNRLVTRASRRHAMAPMAMEEMRATAAAARRQLPASRSRLRPRYPLIGRPVRRSRSVTFPERCS